MMAMEKKNPGVYMKNSVYPFYINRIFPCTSTIKPYRMDRKGCLQEIASTNQNRKVGNNDSTCIDADFKFRGGVKEKAASTFDPFVETEHNQQRSMQTCIHNWVYFLYKEELNEMLGGRGAKVLENSNSRYRCPFQISPVTSRVLES